MNERHARWSQLYDFRPLVAGAPDISKLGISRFYHSPNANDNCEADRARVETLLRYCSRIIPLDGCKNILVVGCGPRPTTVQALTSLGHQMLAVEAVEQSVVAAREFLGSGTRVLLGTAEALPAEDASQDLVLCESVLEHVDSPTKVLNELYRVTVPGGIALVITTNRLRFDIRGRNSEFGVPFFNWFPRLVQESYVHLHLHFEPRLANYSPRPAVHWFSYDELCQLGRTAGFYQFYSLVDVVRSEDPGVQRSWLRRAALRWTQFNPWIRALALRQVGHFIVMVKRAA